MFRKTLYLISLVVVLGQVAQAADPNIVGHWKFDELSGTIAYDSSGNGRNGTITGCEWVDGQNKWFGKALQLDPNSGDQVDFGDLTAFEWDAGTEDFTIAFWWKCDWGFTGDSSDLIEKYSTYGFRIHKDDQSLSLSLCQQSRPCWDHKYQWGGFAQ